MICFTAYCILHFAHAVFLVLARIDHAETEDEQPDSAKGHRQHRQAPSLHDNGEDSQQKRRRFNESSNPREHSTHRHQERAPDCAYSDDALQRRPSVRHRHCFLTRHATYNLDIDRSKTADQIVRFRRVIVPALRDRRVFADISTELNLEAVPEDRSIASSFRWSLLLLKMP